AGADGVDHDRDALLLRDLHFAQVLACVGVVKDAAAAEDEEVEPFDLGLHLGAREPAHVERALDAVPPLRVLGVPREHGDLDVQVAAQLRDDGVQDRLVAEVEPAVGAGNPDPDRFLGQVHGAGTCKRDARGLCRCDYALSAALTGLPGRSSKNWAMACWMARGSVGLTKWWWKPAAATCAMSSFWP